MAATATAPKELATEQSLGTFGFVKETPNTKRFEQERGEDERNLLQYVQKDVLEKLGDPESIEVIIRPA